MEEQYIREAEYRSPFSPQKLWTNLLHTKHKLQPYFPVILIVFHLIGIGIFLYPERPVGLSGFNMLLCATLILLTSRDWYQELFLFVFIGAGGVMVEVVGVNTGLLFGTYEYGTELGWKIFGVPIVLALNWYCVVVASSHLVMKWLPSWNIFQKAFLAALLCVAMDFLIEPVAIQYDFWNWEGGIIPIFNYVCWGIFSLIFSLVYLYFVKEENRTAWSLFFIWAVFFLVLNFV